MRHFAQLSITAGEGKKRAIKSREFRAILFKCLFSTNEIQMFMDMELVTARNSEKASDSVRQVFFDWKFPPVCNT